MNRIRRMIVIAIAAVLATAGLNASPDDRADAAIVQIAMLDWNTAGNAGAYGDGDTNWLLDILQPYLDGLSPQASIITLQEVCFNQTQYIWNTYLIGDFGTSYAFYAALPSGSGPGICGNNAYGNAVFLRGGGTTGTKEFDNQVSSPEDRGMACLNGAIGGIMPIGACSVHTVHTSTSVANAQTFEAGAEVNYAVNAGYKYMVAGDFNLRFGTSDTGPGSAISAFYAQPFYEADNVASPNNRYTHSLGKIDYIFLSQNANGYWRDLKLWPYHSDHRLLEAFVNVVI